MVWNHQSMTASASSCEMSDDVEPTAAQSEDLIVQPAAVRGHAEPAVEGDDLFEETQVVVAAAPIAAAPVAAGSARLQGDSGEREGAALSLEDFSARLENKDERAKEYAGLPPNEPKPPTRCFQRSKDGTNDLLVATSTSTDKGREESTNSAGGMDSVGVGQGTEDPSPAIGQTPGDFASEDVSRNSEHFEHLMSDSGTSGVGNGTSCVGRTKALSRDVDGFGAAGPATTSRETRSDPTNRESRACADDGIDGEGAIIREMLVLAGNQAPPESTARNFDKMRADSESLAPPSDRCGIIDTSAQDGSESRVVPRQSSDDESLKKECHAGSSSRRKAEGTGATGGSNGRDQDRHRGEEEKEEEEEESADAMSFVKDDDISGSDDEFGRGVAMHIGDQQRRQQQEEEYQPRHRRSQPDQNDQGLRADGGGEEDSKKKYPLRVAFVRPRRLSMANGSEVQRALTQELLGIGRTVERCMGEEEADREEEHRLTLLNVTPGDIAGLFKDDDDDEDDDEDDNGDDDDSNVARTNINSTNETNAGNNGSSKGSTIYDNHRDADPRRLMEGIKGAADHDDDDCAGADSRGNEPTVNQHERRSSSQRGDGSLSSSRSLPSGARRKEPEEETERRAETVLGEDSSGGDTGMPPPAAVVSTTAAGFRRRTSSIPFVGGIVPHPSCRDTTGTEPSRLRKSSFSRLKAGEITHEASPDVKIPGDDADDYSQSSEGGRHGVGGGVCVGRDDGDNGDSGDRGEKEASMMAGGEVETEPAAVDREDGRESSLTEAEEFGDEQRKGSTGGEPRRPKGPGPIVMNASQCEYAIVRECAMELGWHLCETKFSRQSDPLTKKPRTDATNPHTTADASYTCTHKGMCNKLWNVMWHDHGNFEDHLHGLQSFQYYSHLPGLSFFARKAGLAMLMSRMYQEAPKEFKFYPETWILPAEMNDFRTQFGPRGTSKSIFIVKPDSGCQGKGIFLTKQLNSVAALLGKSVAQRYLTNPLLIDGYKFDLRLYVLVTSVDPMRIFLFDDGLVRICTEAYEPPAESNIDKTTMHLTNYSVNKASSNFTSDDMGEGGFKRSIKWFKKWLEGQGYDSAALWARLADACVKTLLTVGPMLRREYFMANPIPGNTSATAKGKAAVAAASGAPAAPHPLRSTCFTIVGMDLMVDDELEPWIIEINHLPSFRTETGMDYRIKKQLVFNTLSLLDVRVGGREEWQQEMERLKRSRFFGLPSKAAAAGGAGGKGGDAGGGGGAAVPTGGGGGGGSPKYSAKKKNRSRLAAGRARENFEQTVKGGFERVFPPSETAPNTKVSYTKVLRVAEKVFSSLSKYQSPAHSPRSTSPSHLSPRGNRGDSAASPIPTSPRSPRTSQTPPAQPPTSPRQSLSSPPPPLQPSTGATAELGDRHPFDSWSASARPLPSVGGVSGDGGDVTSPASTSSESVRANTAETAPTSAADTAGEKHTENRFSAGKLSPEATIGIGSDCGVSGGVDDDGGVGGGNSRVGGDSARRRVEFALTDDGGENNQGGRGIGTTAEVEVEQGEMASPSPSLSRRRSRGGRGNRNKKGRNYTNKSPSRSPARRRGRGCGAARRDWEKEAKRRKKLYKKAIAKAEAEEKAMQTEENSLQFIGNGNGEGWEGDTWPGGGEGMVGGHDARGVIHPENGRESMVDLEGPRQQQRYEQQQHQQQRQQQRPRWGEAESLEFQQSDFDTRSPLRPTARTQRPASGGPAYRGMGSIVQNVTNTAVATGWRRGRGGGAAGSLPDGCGLRPVARHRSVGDHFATPFPSNTVGGGAAGDSPGTAERQHPKLHHSHDLSSPAPLPCASGGCWPTRAPFRPSTAGPAHGSAMPKLPPFRFSRAKLGDPIIARGDGGGVHGMHVERGGGLDGSGGGGGVPRGGVAMAGKPGSAPLYDAHTVRRPVKVPTAATAAVATTDRAAVPSVGRHGRGQPAQYSSSFPDGRRKEYDAIAMDGTRTNYGGESGSHGHRRPQTSIGSRRAAYQRIVNLLPPISATPTKTVNACSNLGFRSPMIPSGSAKIRPTSSPRKLTSGGVGGGNARRRTRACESVPSELIMPTVSLCLGGVDDSSEPLAGHCPDDYHRFEGDNRARGAQRMRRRVSPASLLAQATAAACPAGGVPQHAPSRPSVDRIYAGGGGCNGGGECIRPAEETAVGRGDKSAARSHGFRRWRPGES